MIKACSIPAPLMVLAGLPNLLINPCFTRDFQVEPEGGGICPYSPLQKNSSFWHFPL